MIDVSYFRLYAEINDGSERKVCIVWFKLVFGSEHAVLKSQVSLSRTFLAVLVFLLMSQLMLLSCFLVILLKWIFLIVKVMIVLAEVFAGLYCILIFNFFSVVIAFAFNVKHFATAVFFGVFFLFLLLDSVFGRTYKSFLPVFHRFLPRTRVAILAKISLHSLENFCGTNMTWHVSYRK